MNSTSAVDVSIQAVSPESSSCAITMPGRSATSSAATPARILEMVFIVIALL